MEEDNGLFIAKKQSLGFVMFCWLFLSLIWWALLCDFQMWLDNWKLLEVFRFSTTWKSKAIRNQISRSIVLMFVFEILKTINHNMHSQVRGDYYQCSIAKSFYSQSWWFLFPIGFTCVVNTQLMSLLFDVPKLKIQHYQICTAICLLPKIHTLSKQLRIWGKDAIVGGFVYGAKNFSYQHSTFNMDTSQYVAPTRTIVKKKPFFVKFSFLHFHNDLFGTNFQFFFAFHTYITRRRKGWFHFQAIWLLSLRFAHFHNRKKLTWLLFENSFCSHFVPIPFWHSTCKKSKGSKHIENSSWTCLMKWMGQWTG